VKPCFVDEIIDGGKIPGVVLDQFAVRVFFHFDIVRAASLGPGFPFDFIHFRFVKHFEFLCRIVAVCDFPLYAVFVLLGVPPIVEAFAYRRHICLPFTAIEFVFVFAA
jgi:hypothetical protein